MNINQYNGQYSQEEALQLALLLSKKDKPVVKKKEDEELELALKVSKQEEIARKSNELFEDELELVLMISRLENE